jgi:tetratricopeptide (TPR) repeat protein
MMRKQSWVMQSGAFCAAFLLGTQVLAAPLHRAVREGFDRNDIEDLRGFHPRALESLEAGEAELDAGHAARAAELLERARKEAPRSAVITRELCQALTDLGRREQAIAMCNIALANGGTRLEMRALVGALMSGTAPPTPKELAQAWIMTNGMIQQGPNRPWGYAAQCDIAQRFGQPVLFKDCLVQLQRVAPGHFETERALRSTRFQPHTTRLWLGWGALGLLGLLTAAHAFRTSRRRRSRQLSPSLAAFLLGAGALLSPAVGEAAEPVASAASAPAASGAAPAASPSPKGSAHWVIDDRDPESGQPTPAQRDANPLEFGYYLMDLSDRAEHAFKKGDYLAAAKYFRALGKAVPERSVAFTKLCDSYAAAGDRLQAIAACREALVREGVVVNDYTHFVHLVLEKPGTLDATDVTELSEVIAHLKTETAGRDEAEALGCQLAARILDVKRLNECVAGLVAQAPNDPKTITYQWTLAIAQGDREQAERQIARGQEVGVEWDTIARMQHATSALKPRWRRYLVDPKILLSFVLALGAALALFLARRRSKLRPAQTA